SHRAAALADEGGVDADRLALAVDERATAVTGVDRGIGLDEVVVRPLTDHATGRADDARGDGLLQTERVADGHNGLADLKLCRVAERDQRQALRVDLQKGEVGLRVTAEYLRGHLATVGERHLDLGRTVDDMIVGHDVTVGVDDEAGAEAPDRAAWLIAEELAEEVVELAPLVARS